jgi:hypothetical protein
MKWLRALKRTTVIMVLYGIGIAEVYYLPRYGLQWMFIALGLTAFLAGFWVREHWDD